MRRLAAVTGLVLAGVLVTSCAPDPMIDGDVCPAIGYITVLEVDAAAIPGAAWVQLCDDAVCSLAPGTATGTAEQIGATEQEGIWTFSFHGRAPAATATIRVTDDTGALLKESEHHIDWVDSTARCGGPSTADTVVLIP